MTGDHYGGEFVKELFRKHGISYELCKQPKSDLFRDLLPWLNSGHIVLPRHDRLVAQICGLERRTGRSGRDSIDHAPNGHDDIANAVAGAAAATRSKYTIRYLTRLGRRSPTPMLPEGTSKFGCRRFGRR